MTLTREDVQRALPANLKSSVTEELVDTLNQIAGDPVVADSIRNNFISYTAVLKDGKFKTADYVNAVIYVSYKLMGLTNHESYMRTFPDRYQDLLAKGYESKDIASLVSAYNRGKLVNLIFEQTMVPTWVLNQDLYQKAINETAAIGFDQTGDVSAKVRVEALNNLMVQLKRPETIKAQLDVNVNESSGMNELQATLADLAQKQREMIESGYEVRLIAAQPLIEGEYKDA